MCDGGAITGPPLAVNPCAAVADIQPVQATRHRAMATQLTCQPQVLTELGVTEVEPGIEAYSLKPDAVIEYSADVPSACQ